MEILAKQLQPLFCEYGMLETSHNYNTKIAELKYTCKIKTADEWNKYTDTMTIIVADNLYNIKHQTCDRCQCYETNNYSLSYDELKSFIAKQLEVYKQVE